MASPLWRPLAPGQAGSKVNGTVGLAALAQRMVVAAGGRLDREGRGLRAMSGSKENTSFAALEALVATLSTARNDNCRAGRLIARRHRLGREQKPITASRLGLDNSRNDRTTATTIWLNDDTP
jgi:hypothetical protein